MEVLYEDNHLIIVNKSTSEIVQGDKTGDTPLSETLKVWLKEKYHKPGNVFVGVTHRLDRPVSGIVVFAKTSKALARLNEMFRTGEVKKTYWAIVQSAPEREADEITHYLVRNEKLNKSVAWDTPRPNAKEAVLAYRTLARSENYTLLEVSLKTGRHHQIPMAAFRSMPVASRLSTPCRSSPLMLRHPCPMMRCGNISSVLFRPRPSSSILHKEQKGDEQFFSSPFCIW